MKIRAGWHSPHVLSDHPFSRRVRPEVDVRLHGQVSGVVRNVWFHFLAGVEPSPVHITLLWKAVDFVP